MEELYKLKIAALLHDPPSKPWLLLSGRGHEEKAVEAIKQLAGLDKIPEAVRRADALAASIDRYVLSVIMGEQYIPGFLRVARVKLKNSVNPLFEVEVGEPSEKAEEGYWEKLGALSRVGDLRLRYLLLYALYELLWVGEGLPEGPADTRVPTHTVFDHDYATATALNWAGGEGLLVGLDVAGVQEFVKSSRKLRDAWASSYLVSALLWYTILPLVSQLGPDVVVTPSLRFSPIFHYWLFNEAGKLLGSQAPVEQMLKEVQWIIYLSDTLREMYEELQLPPYATLPERATLVLPSEQQVAGLLGGSVEEAIKARFAGGWKLLWKAARELARARAREDRGSLHWKFVDKVFEAYEREFSGSRFEEVPPLALRVEVVPAPAAAPGEEWKLYDRAYRELSKKMGLRKYRRLDPPVRLDLGSLTERAFGRGLGYPRRSRRGFEHCTSCGALPALVVLPAGEGEAAEEDEYGLYVLAAVSGIEAEKVEKCLRALRSGERCPEFEQLRKLREDRRVELEQFKQFFTPGERLCPWCFLKRVVSLEPGLLRALLLGIEESEVDGFISKLEETPLRFPSVSDVASLRLKEKLAERWEEALGAVRSLEKELVSEHVLPLLRAAAGEGRTVWPREKELAEEVEKLPLDEGGRITLKGLLLLNPELLWYAGGAARRGWTRALRELGLSKYLWRYYSLVTADGDSIGDLIEGDAAALHPPCEPEAGKRDERPKMLLRALLEASGEGDFQKLLKAIAERATCVEEEVCRSADRALNQWAGTLASQLGIPVGEVRSRLERAVKTFEEILRGTARPLSLSYHTAVSAALARQAMLDAAVITSLGGFVAYAGGDDLLAFLPVDASLRAVHTTRRLFAGAKLDADSGKLLGPPIEPSSGFVKVRGAHFPALPGVGRSYCVYVAHYLYPLQVVLQRARGALKAAKSRMSTRLDWGELCKDFLVVAYSPRGGEEAVAVPLSLIRVAHFALNLLPGAQAGDYLDSLSSLALAAEGLLRALDPLADRPAYSTSLLYDAEDVGELILRAAEEFRGRGDSADIVQKVFERVLQRNLARRAGERVAWSELQSLLSSRWRAALLTGLVRLAAENREEKWHLLTGIVRSVRLLRGGMRA